MSSVTSITSAADIPVAPEGQISAVVVEKIDDRHYVVKIAGQLVEVISTESAFDVGDKLMLKIAGRTPQKVELNVIGIVASDLGDKALKILTSFGIEASEENINLVKSMLGLGVTPDKGDLAAAIDIARSFPASRQTAVEVATFLLKNGIVPSKELVEYLLALERPAPRGAPASATMEPAASVKAAIEFAKSQANPAKVAASLARLITAGGATTAGAREVADALYRALSGEQAAEGGKDPAKTAEALFDRAARAKILNSINSAAAEGRTYLEIPLTLSGYNATVRLLSEERSGEGAPGGEKRNTIYIALNLEKSGNILARLDCAGSRCNVDVYAESLETHEFISSHSEELKKGLEAQGFSGTVTSHHERKVKFPPIFRTSRARFDILA